MTSKVFSLAQSLSEVITSIDGIEDVDTSSVAPATGQALVWDGVSLKWVPGTVSGGGGEGGTTLTVTTTNISKTITSFERCVVTEPNLTITLPASPAIGDEVSIAVLDFINTSVDGNGKKIMGLTEPLILDIPNVAIGLFFISNTLGWRIV
jgi:hypothetical protein